MTRKKILIGIAAAFALAATAAFAYAAATEVRADADGDGVPETYRLRRGALHIAQAGRERYASPGDWDVRAVVVGDVTGDGAPDVVLSVWKAGNFGPSKPFWVAHNDMTVKNHLFVFSLTAEGLKPEWQSSNLEAPNCGIAIADTDGDGRNELAVTEGDYADAPRCVPRNRAVWKWDGWGFVNQSRTPIR